MRALAEYLRGKGVEVFFNLDEPDLDIIVLVEPRKNLKISAYTDKDIFRYIKRVNKKAIVIHRVNECDERKGTTEVNKILKRANLCADHTVFVSGWLRDLLNFDRSSREQSTVILNGADREIFNPDGYLRWNRREPLKIVTHHWGGHRMKGFDIYELLDELLEKELFETKVSFTYIGRLPDGFKFKNADYIEPRHGKELADLLKRNHVYLTASRNDPCPNHPVEGASCGLPLLYRNSGGLPELCEGHGVMFDETNFVEKLREMIKTYEYWVDKMVNYPHTSEHMSENYYNLFLRLLDRRDEIIKGRKRWRKNEWRIKRLCKGKN